MINLHNKLVIVTGINSPYRGEIGYTTLCSSDDKYAVQFPTHKTIINRSNLSLYSCVLQKLEAAEQTIKEIIPYLHHHDNCQSYIERGGERDPCDCGLEVILNRRKS